jgi:uroporphyrin-III C-methyltransferase / precorrin-2 dehydrogenase / sirohydrochlorin ferrochelatase
METFPFFVKIDEGISLVVGGGEIARHKASMLLKANAKIRMVAPEIHPSTQTLLDNEPNITLLQREFQESDLDDIKLVIAATDSRHVNGHVAELAKARNIWVNAVDMPELGNLIFPSIVDRSPMVIAVGSGGRSPVLVRLLRARIETLIPSTYGNLSALVGEMKERVKKAFPNVDIRRRFWDLNLQGAAGTAALNGDIDQARTLLERALSKGDVNLQGGEVYLVGGGPGDPDLLTFKALRLMQQADVVMYDRLVSKPVLELVRREAERIYVGKEKNPYSITQENINEKLAEYAERGLRVLRLKGGDPFIFGRGGEELVYLAERGVPFQVVPGITAASGCSAYAGIPLTHRDHAQSVRFITGHQKGGKYNLNWKEFVTPNQTLVFYMGLAGLEEICEKLIEYGLDQHTPAALVEKGTSPAQRVIVSDIKHLPADVRKADAKAPTLIIIGTVVNLREELFPEA